MFTLPQLTDLVKQVFEHAEYPTPRVVINNRFSTRTLARASWGNDSYPETIEFNKAALAFEVDELITLIRHEMMHLITKRKDNEPEFQMACRVNNIPQNGDGFVFKGAPKGIGRYTPMCTVCGVIGTPYQRKSKHVVGVMTSPELYTCIKCKSKGTLVIVERREQ